MASQNIDKVVRHTVPSQSDGRQSKHLWFLLCCPTLTTPDILEFAKNTLFFYSRIGSKHKSELNKFHFRIGSICAE